MTAQSASLEQNYLAPHPLSNTLLTEALYPMIRYADEETLGMKIAVKGGAFILSTAYAVILLIETSISAIIGYLGYAITMIAKSSTPEWIQKHTWTILCYSYHGAVLLLNLITILIDYTPTPLELRILNLVSQGHAFLTVHFLLGQEFDLLTEHFKQVVETLLIPILPLIDEFQRVGHEDSPYRGCLLELKEAAQEESPAEAVIKLIQKWFLFKEIKELVRDTLIEWYNSLDPNDLVREDILDMAPSVFFPLSRQVLTKMALKGVTTHEEQQALLAYLSEGGRDSLSESLTEGQKTAFKEIYDFISESTVPLSQGETLRPYISGYEEALKRLI